METCKNGKQMEYACVCVCVCLSDSLILSRGIHLSNILNPN